ncbi:MAG: iron-sulfur cluster assembly scaffold protein [Candidatus Thorarchaeota archaeon]
MYTDKVLDHFRNPRNQREMKDCDAVGRAGSAEYGVYMFVYIKVKEEGDLEIIDDISFETFGCAAAIASSSMLTEIAKGKSLEEAEKFTKMEIVEALGGLPEPKLHCSVMATDRLKEAIKVYHAKKKEIMIFFLYLIMKNF